MSEVTEKELREYQEHHSPKRHYTCFSCNEEIVENCYAEVLDGKYRFCERCCDELTEVMDEIDAERRRLKMELDNYKNMEI